MSSSNEVIEAIKNYQERLDRYVERKNNDKILYVLSRLQKLPIKTVHLEETGVGRTVNGLKKFGDEVGEKAKDLVNHWKMMVVEEEQAQEAANNEEIVDSAVESAQESSHSENEYHSTHLSKDTIHYESGNENYNSSHRLSDTNKNESDIDDNDYYEDKSRNSSYHKLKEDKHRISEVTKRRDEKDKKNDKNNSKRKRESSESSEERHKSKKKSSSQPTRTRDSSASSEDNEYVKYEKKKSKSRRDSTSSESSHKKHKSSKSTKDYKGSKSKTTDKSNGDRKHKEHRSESKHKSESKSNRQESDIKSNKKDKTEEHPRKDRYTGNESKLKEESVKLNRESKEEKKSKSSNPDGKERRDREKSNNEEKHSHKEKEKSSEKDKSRSNHPKTNKEKSNFSSKQKASSSSSSSRQDDSDKKERKDKSSSASKQKIVNGIGSESGASFAEALGMCEPVRSNKNKKKSLPSSSSIPEKSGSDKHSSRSSSSFKIEPPEVDEKYVPELLKEPKLDPLNLNISSLLPEITPNYRPITVPIENHSRKIISDDEALSRVMNNRNYKTKVYSGNKTVGKVESLFDICVRVLQENIDALEYTGGVPFSILKPVLEKATPDQLFNMEHHNPYLIEDTDDMWKLHCQKEFRTKQREELETWREMYMRCLDEREARLNAVTANIKQSQEKSLPVRTAKLAYIDSVAKPPRNIARKQAKNGIINEQKQTPSSKLATLAASGEAAKVSVPNPGNRAVEKSASTSTHSNSKPKKAPLMAKTLSFLKNRFRR